MYYRCLSSQSVSFSAENACTSAIKKREATLPDIGLLRVRDAETGRDILLDTGDIKTRLAYSSRYKKTVEEFDKVFAHARCDTISLGTEEDYIRALHLFFRKRAKR